MASSEVWTCSVASSRRAPVPDGRDRHRVRARLDPPPDDLPPRGRRDAGAGPAREAARGDVRARMAGSGPGLQVQHAGAHHPRLQRLVPGLSPNARFWQRRFARRAHHLPRRRPSNAARLVCPGGAQTRRPGARRRRRQGDRQPLAGTPGSQGHRLRLRGPERAGRSGRGRAGGGSRPRRTTAQPHGVALGLRRGSPPRPLAGTAGRARPACPRRDRRRGPAADSHDGVPWPCGPAAPWSRSSTSARKATISRGPSAPSTQRRWHSALTDAGAKSVSLDRGQAAGSGRPLRLVGEW